MGLANVLKKQFLLPIAFTSLLLWALSQQAALSHLQLNPSSKLQSLFDNSVNTSDERSTTKQLIFKTTQLQDENEGELLNLGLIPHHSIRIETIDGEVVTDSKVLHGRFLHITDMHPDPLIKPGSSIGMKCHRKETGMLGDETCHAHGDAMSGCDSPMDLYLDTLKWVRENLKDKIDFVVWTGDNIRHDNDRKHPRLEIDILNSNQKVADHMSETFMDDGEEDKMPLDRRVKIVPSLGNNDVYPHNLFAPGPTLQTREMYKIWRNFVPAEQMHTFDRGVYFFREVIPGKLAVLSINTLYFFKSNPLNDNCDNRKQPGYKLFEWLAVTLKELRKRKMKVWLTGHVPPIPKNLHSSCYTKMSVWQHEYRDIIIGALYGHMNIDHFVPLDSVKAWKTIQKGLVLSGLEEDANSLNFSTYDEEDPSDDGYDQEDVQGLYRDLGLAEDDRVSRRYDNAPSGKVTYLEDTRDTFYSTLKGNKKGGLHGERYSFAHISSSIIPTFNPGMRIWEYNISSLYSSTEEQQEFEPWSTFFERVEVELDEGEEIANMLASYPKDHEIHTEFKSLRKDKTIPPVMDPSLPLGPAYIPQLFSPERYAQYYVDLDSARNPATFEFGYQLQYVTDDDHYNMDTLLVKDWVNFGRTLAKSGPPKSSKGKKGKKGGSKALDTDEDARDVAPIAEREDFEVEAARLLWDQYIDRAFISTGYQDLPCAKDG